MAGRNAIFYRNGAKMFAVAVDLSRDEPTLERPVVLFDEQYAYASGVATANYDVTPGGDFIMLRPVAGSSRVLVTLNWIEELKKILASGPRP